MLYTLTLLFLVGALTFLISRQLVFGLRRRRTSTNVLEMMAVILALNTFLYQVSGESVVLMSHNATVVAYLRKQGGTVSRAMCDLAR